MKEIVFGMNLLKRFVSEEPVMVKSAKAGMVPKPKAIINRAASVYEGSTIALAAATYVSPHGKKPLATPLSTHLFLMDSWLESTFLTRLLNHEL